MKKAVKRAITILMGGILAAGLIAGCGKDNNTASNTPSGGNSVLLSEVTGEVSGEETESAPAAETAEQTESAAVPEEEENVVWEYTDDAFSYTMDLSEYIELPDYSNITLTTVKEEVTDEDLEAQIDYILEQNSTYETVEDRTTAISGDRAIIDFEGRMNGETFEGGSASGYGLDLGSGNFIPGFEDGIIGHEVGDKFDIELTFPEDYTEQYAGKDVTFTIYLSSLQELVKPELTDEFVQQFGLTGPEGEAIEDVEAFRGVVRNRMEALAESNYTSNLRSEIIQYLEDNSTFIKDPPAIVVDRLKDMIEGSYRNYAAAYGMDLETLLLYMGMETDTYNQDVQDSAELFARQLMLTNYVAQVENITLTDEELEEEIAKEAESEGVSVEEFKEGTDIRSFKEQLLGEKAIDLIADMNKE